MPGEINKTCTQLVDSLGTEFGVGSVVWILENEFRLCADTAPGTYDYEFTALDGVGGKSTFPLSVHIPEASEGDGAAYWGGTAADYDADGYENMVDDLPFNASESLDTDGDGQGDNADTDDDDDGVPDTEDAFPFDASETSDFDADGLGDNADPDDDNDGFPDPDENLVSKLSISAGGRSLCGTEREGLV